MELCLPVNVYSLACLLVAWQEARHGAIWSTHDTLSPTQSAPSNRGCSRGSSPRDQSTCLGARWKRRHLQSRLLFAGIWFIISQVGNTHNCNVNNQRTIPLRIRVAQWTNYCCCCCCCLFVCLFVCYNSNHVSIIIILIRMIIGSTCGFTYQ